MVRILLFLMLFSFNLQAQNLQNVIVSSEMNYTQLFVGQPLTGTVSITYDKTLKIDETSFKVGTKPLKVKFLNTVVISNTSPLVISIYSFEIPPLPKGLHVLPEISVKVGNKIYKSFSTAFEVLDNQGISNQPIQSQPVQSQPVQATSPPPQQVLGPAKIENTSLSLETKVDAPKKLYPGQEINVTYKFLYKGHIELTKEVLPLLDFPGLKKVGDKQNKDYMDKDLNVSEFSQKYTADQPGIFPSGPSIVEGRAYQETPGGRKIYATDILHTENPPVVLEVLPFPRPDKPASFNGSLGKYTFKASLKNSNAFTPGEKITLLLEMSGDPDFLSTVQAPDLCCQPGFSGNFKPSDLPPISTLVAANTKQFLVDLTPLSATLNEIPPIEFSSFDPSSGKYLIQKSASMPIVLRTASNPNQNPNQKIIKDETIPADETLKNPSPIEILALFPLTKSDLQDLTLGTFWNLLFIPVFLVLLLMAHHYKNDWKSPTVTTKEQPSQELLKSALQKEAGSPDFYRLLQKAFLVALKERDIISSSEIEPENLDKTGLAGDVRVFLTRLEEVRFSGNKSFSQAIISSAKELYQKITGVIIS